MLKTEYRQAGGWVFFIPYPTIEDADTCCIWRAYYDASDKMKPSPIFPPDGYTIYLVLAGRAVFKTGKKVCTFAAGSLAVFVPGMGHSLEEVVETTEILAIHYPQPRQSKVRLTDRVAEYATLGLGENCSIGIGYPFKMARAIITEPLKAEVLHSHNVGDEMYFFISGGAEMEVNGEKYTCQGGDMVIVGPGEEHRITKVHKPVDYFVFNTHSEPDDKVV